jgi:hypothetical protein
MTPFTKEKGTPMRLYVAGSYRDTAAVREVMAAVKREGHTISHDWTEKEAISCGLPEGSPEYQAFLYQCGREDLQGVLSADGLVLVGHPMCRDAMAEFGMALGFGLPCFVFHPERRPSVFYTCDRVFLCRNFAELLGALSQWTLKEKLA